MKRLLDGLRGVAAALLASAATLAQTTGSPPQSPPVFRAGADAVTVDVAVQRDRRPVAGLKVADFTLLDNGVSQDITDVASETLPIDVTFLLDVSASVTGEVLDQLRRALRQVRADLVGADRLRLVTFNMRVRRLADFGDPASDLDRALASVRGQGSSAVLDALAVALAAAETPGRRRLIVLFSDGQDSGSVTDPETLSEMARRSASTIAIVLGSPSLERPASLLRVTSPPASQTVGALSERIATDTGGIVTSVKPGEPLSSTFRRMLQEFRSSYVLYFTPRGVERAGTHTLEVSVKRPGVSVRARRSYVWD
jgi:Ca-activated chloride channel family protein